MKYIITENRLENAIMNYINDYYHSIIVYDGKRNIPVSQAKNSPRCKIEFLHETDDSGRLTYLRFYYYRPCWFRTSLKEKGFTQIDFDYQGDIIRFNSLFGDSWHGPFVKWFENKFGLEVKDLNL